METIDIVFDQVIDSSKSRKTASALSDRVKHILAHAMPNDCIEIDLDADTLLDTIKYIRKDLKTWSVHKPNYQILKGMLTFQKWFYMMSGCYDLELSLIYKRYIDHHEEIYGLLCKELSQFKLAKFTYTVDLGLPLASSVVEVDKYQDSLKIAVRSLYRGIFAEALHEVKGFGPFLKFHEEVIGAEDKWSDTLEQWLMCKEIYALVHVAEKKKAEIIREISQGPYAAIAFFNTDDMDNATHKLDGYLAEAEALIASAAAGTFPY